MMIAGAIGFLTAYLLDPDRGRSRRARIADQSAARARRIAEGLRSRVRYQGGVVRGLVHRITNAFPSPGDEDIDADTLVQKIRSEAIGQWRRSATDPNGVEVLVDQGHVAITGTVATKEDHDRLIDLVLDVDGVTTLEDRLSVVS